MPAYTTTVTHATGDVLPATDWNTYIRDNFAFLHDMGADLPSAGTITPTNQFHRVTGTTTITAIAAPSGTGQGGNRLLLKFISAACSITAGAAIVLTNGTFTSTAGSMIEFVWDSTAAAWVETRRSPGVGQELDFQSITTSGTTSATTEGTATAIITGNSVTYDGSKVYVEVAAAGFALAGIGTGVLLRDSTVLGQFGLCNGSNSNLDEGGVFRFPDTPPAGAHTYKFSAFVSAGTLTVFAGAGGTGAKLASTLRVVRA